MASTSRVDEALICASSPVRRPAEHLIAVRHPGADDLARAECPLVPRWPNLHRSHPRCDQGLVEPVEVEVEGDEEGLVVGYPQHPQGMCTSLTCWSRSPRKWLPIS